MTPLALSMNPAAVAKRAERDRLRQATGKDPIDRANGVRAPSVGGSIGKREYGRRMHEVDADYRRTQLRLEGSINRRCCTRCKTPFGICAAKDCGCHR